MRLTSYNPELVSWYYAQHGIPRPTFEFSFHPSRRWRFDLCWPEARVYLEVQGGVWNRGRHARGKGIRNDMDKFSEAACLGWRGLYCQPTELCMGYTVDRIKRALGLERNGVGGGA